MSITLDTVNWGSAPNIGVTLAYDSQRSGQDMRYRIYASLAPVTEIGRASCRERVCLYV